MLQRGQRGADEEELGGGDSDEVWQATKVNFKMTRMLQRWMVERLCKQCLMQEGVHAHTDESRYWKGNERTVTRHCWDGGLESKARWPATRRTRPAITRTTARHRADGAPAFKGRCPSIDWSATHHRKDEGSTLMARHR